MKAKLDGFKFLWYFTLLAIVLIQCSLAKTDDADTELDVAKKSEKKGIKYNVSNESYDSLKATKNQIT